MTDKITVDQEKCIGCGTCIALAPKTFGFNKNGKSEVINQEGDNLEEIKKAAASCPTGAIVISEE